MFEWLNRYTDLTHLLYAIGITLAGIFVGFLIERFVIPRLLYMSTKTSWNWDNVLVKAMSGKVIFLTTIAALHYFVIGMMHLDKRVYDLVDNTIIVLSMIIFTLVFRDVISGILYMFMRRKRVNMPSTTIVINFVGLLVLVTGTFFILHFLDVPIAPLMTAMGMGGLAIALALQDTLANLFSGLQIVLSKKVAPGDYIKLSSGEEGYIKDIAWRNTTMTDLLNNTIVIPNSKMGSSIVTNYKLLDQTMLFTIEFGVGYSSDLDLVEMVTLDVAKQTMKEGEGSSLSYDPFFHFHTFSEYSVNCSVRILCYDYKDHLKLKHSFIKKLHKRFQLEGIEIPYPIRTLNVKHVKELKEANIL